MSPVGLGRACRFRPPCWAARHLIVVFLCCLCACRDVATIASSESRSPDGRWIATVRTDQYGGPGTAAILSTVFLKQATGRQDSMEILQLSQDAPSVDLKLNWSAPAHLEITYRQPASVDFQALKYGGVDISVKDVSGADGHVVSNNRGAESVPRRISKLPGAIPRGSSANTQTPPPT